MSCLFGSGGGSQKYNPTEQHQMEYMRDSIYESAFTYNTEKQFRNEYTFGDMNDLVNPNEDTSGEDVRSLASKMIELLLVVLSSILLVLTFPFSLLLSLKFVSSFERLIVMRLGRALPLRGPGTTFVLPCIDRTSRVDVRVASYSIPAVQVITVDRGLVEMSVVVMAKVVDPMATYCGLQDKDQALRSLSYNTIYNCMVKRMLCDLTDPASLSAILNKAQEQLNGIISGLGVEVTQVIVQHLKVHKQGESQAISLFNTLMKSELGTQVMGSLGSHLKDYISSSGAGAPPMPTTNGNGHASSFQEPSPSRDPELEGLVKKIRSLCDESLTAKVDKYYRIHCVDGSAAGRAEIDLDLRRGTPGWCGWSGSAAQPSVVPHVTFTLKKATLISLVNGSLSPLTAYISGDISVSGSVDDAMGLKHLAERAASMGNGNK